MTDETLGSKSTTPDPEAVPDEVLGAPAPEEAEVEELYGVEDATAPVTEEDFDFSAFVQGARSTRRSVRVTLRADLMADLDILLDQIEDAEKRGEDTDALVGEFEATKAQMLASQRRIVVEARSSEWIKRQRKIAEKTGLQVPGKKASDEQFEHYQRELLLRQMAGQIVHPTKGVTVDALRHLYETNEPELNKIFEAVQSANRSPAGVTPDFSRKSSAARRTG